MRHSWQLVLAVLVSAMLAWPIRLRGVRSRAADLVVSARASAPGGSRGAVGHPVRRVLNRFRGGQVDHQVARHVLAVLDSIVPALSAGLPPEAAFLSAQDSGNQRQQTLVHTLVGHLRRGEPLSLAWQGYADETGAPGLRLLAGAWRISERTGAPLSDVAATSVRVLQDALDSEADIELTLAQARATIRVLTALPLSGPLLAAAVGVNPIDMVGSPISVASMLLGLLLLMLGRGWVARQARAVVRGPVLS